MTKLMRDLLTAILLLAYLAPSLAYAEYRVYLLAITDPALNQTRTVLSTLDDIQYPGYYHLKKSESIVIQDTWMCWGRQGDFKKLCPNPKDPPQ